MDVVIPHFEKPQYGNLLVPLPGEGKFDRVKALEIMMNEYLKQVVLIKKYDDPKQIFDAFIKIKNKRLEIQLEEEFYSDDVILRQIVCYLAQVYLNTNVQEMRDFKAELSKKLVETISSNTVVFNFTPENAPFQSTEFSVCMTNNCYTQNQRQQGKNYDIHFIINPCPYLIIGENIFNQQKKQKLEDGDLKFYFDEEKNKTKLFEFLEKEMIKKYVQIAQASECQFDRISFDFMFDGKLFNKSCKGINPFDNISVKFLDLSIEKAFQTKYFNSNPMKQAINKSIMKRKCYRNLHFLLNMIYESQKVSALKELSLSGLALSQKTLQSLRNILSKQNIEVLDLQGCSIENGCQQLLIEGLKECSQLKSINLSNLTLFAKYDQLKKKRKFKLPYEQYLFKSSLNDEQCSKILESLMFLQNLTEIRWDYEKGTKPLPLYFPQFNQEQVDLIVKKQDILNLQGPLGRGSLEIIKAFCRLEFIQTLSFKNNSLPPQESQQLAILCQSNQSISEFNIEDNKELQFFNEENSCFNCCLKTLMCINPITCLKFFLCGKTCCVQCCCFNDVYNISDIHKQTIETIKMTVYINKKSPKLKELQAEITNMFVKWLKGMGENLQAQINIKQMKEETLKRQQQKLQEEKLKQQELAHKKKLELLSLKQNSISISIQNAGNKTEAIQPQPITIPIIPNQTSQSIPQNPIPNSSNQQNQSSDIKKENESQQEKQPSPKLNSTGTEKKDIHHEQQNEKKDIDHEQKNEKKDIDHEQQNEKKDTDHEQQNNKPTVSENKYNDQVD